MARVPITVMGFRCERCGHEWIPRGASEEDPATCPKCRSPYWNKPRKTTATTYETFRDAIKSVLSEAPEPLTWTEVRTAARLPQSFPNNKWVRKMETEIGLKRQRDAHGIIHWQLGTNADLFGRDESPAKAANAKGKGTPRK